MTNESVLIVWCVCRIFFSNWQERDMGVILKLIGIKMFHTEKNGCKTDVKPYMMMMMMRIKLQHNKKCITLNCSNKKCITYTGF